MAVKQYNRSKNAQREYRAHSYRSRAGKSSVTIECPFCATSVEAFVWSLAGGGKCCPNKKCGAKHTSYGVTFPVLGKEDMVP